MSSPLFELDAGRPLDVICLGRITIDFNPVDFSLSFAECDRFAKYVGGSPANTAAGLAKLGHTPGFIGKVSNDSLGSWVTEYLKGSGVDVSAISRCRGSEALGLAFTEVLPDIGTNLILYRDGPVADLQLEPADVREDYIAAAKCLVVSGTALAAGPSREAAFKALELARKHNLLIVFDIDYRPRTWKSAEEVSVYYTLAAKQADIIQGSREEFDRMDKMIHGARDDRATAAFWFTERARLLIIKHGKEGSRAFCRNGEAWLVKPFPVKLLKATGGGDAYSSAFLSGILKGRSLKEALEMGSASASLVVSRESCSASMPGADELDAFIRESKAQHGEAVVPLETAAR
jgi:5-dehydro-2-deoxygluconokinase